MTDLPTAQDPTGTLFRNVRIFDGTSRDLSEPSHVLVRGSTIAQISPADGPAADGAGFTVIDGGGRVLMPGLIDAHWHAAYTTVPAAVAMTADSGYVQLVAGRDAAA